MYSVRKSPAEWIASGVEVPPTGCPGYEGRHSRRPRLDEQDQPVPTPRGTSTSGGLTGLISPPPRSATVAPCSEQPTSRPALRGTGPGARQVLVDPGTRMRARTGGPPGRRASEPRARPPRRAGRPERVAEQGPAVRSANFLRAAECRGAGNRVRRSRHAQRESGARQLCALWMLPRMAWCGVAARKPGGHRTTATANP